MPCWTVQTTTVDLGQIKNHELLGKALRSLFMDTAIRQPGGNWRFVANGYVVELRNDQAISGMPRQQLEQVVSQIKVAYSTQVVKAAASRFNWTLKQTDATHFVAQKGG